MNPAIQPAADHDLDAIYAIEAVSGGWSRAQIAQEIAAGNVLVARDAPAGDGAAGAIAGFAVGWAVAGEAHVLEIAVDPARRRRGVGRALLMALIETCGGGPALLEVRAGNAPAIGLYRRLGFAEVGRRPRYYHDGEDAILMTRPAGLMNRAPTEPT